jgi:hypothetical protein
MPYWGQGTRNNYQNFWSRPDSRFSSNKVTRDKGMSKRVVTSAIFSGSLISDATTDFTVFQTDDDIIIYGSASNNGTRTILSVALHSITVDFPVKTETTTTSIEIRTP